MGFIPIFEIDLSSQTRSNIDKHRREGLDDFVSLRRTAFKALDQATELALDALRSSVPVKTQALRNSFQVQTKSTKDPFRIVGLNDAPHGSASGAAEPAGAQRVPSKQPAVGGSPTGAKERSHNTSRALLNSELMFLLDTGGVHVTGKSIGAKGLKEVIAQKKRGTSGHIGSFQHYLENRNNPELGLKDLKGKLIQSPLEIAQEFVTRPRQVKQSGLKISLLDEEVSKEQRHIDELLRRSSQLKSIAEGELNANAAKALRKKAAKLSARAESRLTSVAGINLAQYSAAGASLRGKEEQRKLLQGSLDLQERAVRGVFGKYEDAGILKPGQYEKAIRKVNATKLERLEFEVGQSKAHLDKLQKQLHNTIGELHALGSRPKESKAKPISDRIDELKLQVSRQHEVHARKFAQLGIHKETAHHSDWRRSRASIPEGKYTGEAKGTPTKDWILKAAVQLRQRISTMNVKAATISSNVDLSRETAVRQSFGQLVKDKYSLSSLAGTSTIGKGAN